MCVIQTLRADHNQPLLNKYEHLSPQKTYSMHTYNEWNNDVDVNVVILIVIFLVVLC